MIERRLAFVAALSFLVMMTFDVAVIMLILFGLKDVGFIAIVIASVITAGVHSVNSNLLRSVSSFDRLIHNNLSSIPVNAFIEVIRPFCNQKDENDDSSVTEYFTGRDGSNLYFYGFLTCKNKIDFLHPLRPRNFTILYVQTIEVDEEKLRDEPATFDCRLYYCSDISYQLSCGNRPYTQFADKDLNELWKEISDSLEPVLLENDEDEPATLSEVCEFYELFAKIPGIAIAPPNQ